MPLKARLGEKGKRRPFAPGGGEICLISSEHERLQHRERKKEGKNGGRDAERSISRAWKKKKIHPLQQVPLFANIPNDKEGEKRGGEKEDAWQILAGGGREWFLLQVMRPARAPRVHETGLTGRGKKREKEKRPPFRRLLGRRRKKKKKG